MRKSSKVMLAAAAAAIAVSFVPVASASAGDGGVGLQVQQSCSAPGPGEAACFSQRVLRDEAGVRPLATSPQGYNPIDLQQAYKLPALPAAGTPFAWNGQTVAIVDAFDNPNAASDLLAYRTQFNLPLCTGGGIACLFTKVNQNGATSPLPPFNAGWAGEIALDVEMASATCPMCKILLVEATSNSFVNLGISVNRAATMGAQVISNSYGGNEPTNTVSLDNTYFSNHPGVAVLVSSGDFGFSAGPQSPASGKNVIAVGGTRLTRSATAVRGFTEKAWSAAGSGCSTKVAKPTWQLDTGCAMRTIADVSAVADPATGVSVYDSINGGAGSPWLVYGGTSVSAPLIAGMYGKAAHTATSASPSYLYSHLANHRYDIKSGTNGTCGGSYLCKAIAGYDGPTGNGSPKGLGMF